MTEATIRSEFEGQRPRTIELESCDMIVAVGIRKAGEEGHVSQTVMAGGGLKPAELIDITANSTVEILVEAAGNSRERQFQVFSAYILALSEAMKKDQRQTAEGGGPSDDKRLQEHS